MQLPSLVEKYPPPPLASRTYGRGPSGTTRTPGGRIQRPLDAGNPPFKGIDPRNSAPAAGESGGCEKRGRIRRLEEKLAKVVSCGIPLDVCARVILTAGMLVSLLGLFWSVNMLIQKRKPPGDLGVMLTVFQLTWGILLGAASLWGFLLMWGKWRRSPSAAHAFSIAWTLVSPLLFVTVILWFYCHFTLLSRQVSYCRGMTVAAGVGRGDNHSSDDSDDDNVSFRDAPEEVVEDCIRQATRRARWVLAWGIVYSFVCYASLVIIVWARDYRRRLLQIIACEEAALTTTTTTTTTVAATGEKVGLLLAPAPPGTRQHRPRPRDTILRISGTLAVTENKTSPPPPAPSLPAFAGGHPGLGISIDGQGFVGDTTAAATQLR